MTPRDTGSHALVGHATGSHATGSHAVVRATPTGVRLYGVLSATHGDTMPPATARGDDPLPRGAARRVGTAMGVTPIELLRVRDLVAAITPAPFVAAPPSAAELDAMHSVITALFAERAILPAPPGTVFRTRAAVAAWLELHAAALAEALRYVEDRVEARVHARRATPGTVLPGSGSPEPLPDILRALRREAVALLVLRDEPPADTAEPSGEVPPSPIAAPTEGVAQAAFLVERMHWGAFAAAVSREQDARPDIRLTLTGPWPPYDFVRLELGG